MVMVSLFGAHRGLRPGGGWIGNRGWRGAYAQRFVDALARGTPLLCLKVPGEPEAGPKAGNCARGRAGGHHPHPLQGFSAAGFSSDGLNRRCCLHTTVAHRTNVTHRSHGTGDVAGARFRRAIVAFETDAQIYRIRCTCMAEHGNVLPHDTGLHPLPRPSVPRTRTRW